MSDKQPLLSICIPTWNRAKFLKKSLERLISQLTIIPPQSVEIYVSDNASDDNTEIVVKEFANLGLPITYSRNEKNIGAAANFLKCMNWASGKYLLLLGDDDFFANGALKIIVDTLQENDFGMLSIHKFPKIEGVRVYNDNNLFLQQISYWITFMSANIFLKDAVPLIDNPEQYIKTHLLQVPFYIQSACLKRENGILSIQLFDIQETGDAVGGFNFYEVFVKYYLDIWKEFVSKKQISLDLYKNIKKDLLFSYLLWYNEELLLRHKNVAETNATFETSRKGYKIENGWKILFAYYGREPYFYFSFIKLIRTYLKMSLVYFLRRYNISYAKH
jgi:glycosyltransferase involved in cell wall biosynthesis